MRIVMKFGGTSLKDGPSISHVCNLIKRYLHHGYQVVVVCSAMAGMTDAILEVLDKASSGDEEAIKRFISNLLDRHVEAAKYAVSDEKLLEELLKRLREEIGKLEKVLMGVYYLGETTPKSSDYALSFGEILSTMVVEKCLRSGGLDTQFLTGGEAGIITDSRYGSANPLMPMTLEEAKKRLLPLLERGVVPVVTGFIGKNTEGFTTTLGRGGSDYTATLLGAAIGADEVWIWTDVDGVMTADPRLVRAAKTIPILTYEEAMELAYLGAKNFHPRALEPAAENLIPVRIKNTFAPEKAGTLVTRHEPPLLSRIVKAVALIRGVAILTIEGAGIVGGASRVAYEVYKAMNEAGINVIMSSQNASQVSISLIIPQSALQKALSTVKRATEGLEGSLRIEAEDDVCVVGVVGAGMRGTPGVAARVFSTVAKEGINIRMIAQSSSELSISFVVKASDGLKVVEALHREFGLDKVDQQWGE